MNYKELKEIREKERLKKLEERKKNKVETKKAIEFFKNVLEQKKTTAIEKIDEFENFIITKQDLIENKKNFHELLKGEILRDFDVARANVFVIIKLISENVPYREIAQKINCSVMSICKLAKDEEFRDFFRAALESASHIEIEQAKNYLASITEIDNNAILRKKSEQAQFSLYLAKAKNREFYDLNFKIDNASFNLQNKVIIPQFTLKIDQDNKTSLIRVEENAL